MKNAHLRIFAVLFAALVALSAAAGCSSSYSANDMAKSEDNYGSASGGDSDISVETGSATKENWQSSTSGTDGSEVDDTRKIIKTVSLNLETKEFDTAITDIAAITESAGGYIESSYVTGKSYNDYGTVSRSATYTLRVPAAGLDAYVTELSGSFNVLSRQETSTDITDSYFDAKARLDSLVTQEERLLAMLEGATELQYMLQLEDKLSEVRYEIESYNSTLQRYDKSVAMATINISLQEVVEYQIITEQPKSFSERLANSFSESWSDFADGFQNFAVGLVYAFPTLLVLAAIIFAAALIIIRAVKRGNKRRAEVYASRSTDDGTHSGGSENGK
jgi:hypothetical protein